MTNCKKSVAGGVALISVALFLGVASATNPNYGEIDRIYRGWFLKPHEFPWMVKIKVRLKKNVLPYTCVLFFPGAFLVNYHIAKSVFYKGLHS